MEILLATSKNINRILKIYESAKKFMESEHNHQWHAGYPGFKMVKAEIKKKELYVVKDKDEIVGVFAFILGVDHTYLKIDGAWLNDEQYGTIHRLAKVSEARGILEAALNFCLTKTNNIRIDTKDTNISMNKKLLSVGFKRCGIIKIDNGEDRIAYQFVNGEGK